VKMAMRGTSFPPPNGVAVGTRVGMGVGVSVGIGVDVKVAVGTTASVGAGAQLDRKTSKSKVIRIRWLFTMLIPGLNFRLRGKKYSMTARHDCLQLLYTSVVKLPY
jgi:hypothetical protein